MKFYNDGCQTCKDSYWVSVASGVAGHAMQVSVSQSVSSSFKLPNCRSSISNCDAVDKDAGKRIWLMQSLSVSRLTDRATQPGITATSGGDRPATARLSHQPRSSWRRPARRWSRRAPDKGAVFTPSSARRPERSNYRVQIRSMTPVIPSVRVIWQRNQLLYLLSVWLTRSGCRWQI